MTAITSADSTRSAGPKLGEQVKVLDDKEIPWGQSLEADSVDIETNIFEGDLSEEDLSPGLSGDAGEPDAVDETPAETADVDTEATEDAAEDIDTDSDVAEEADVDEDVAETTVEETSEADTETEVMIEAPEISTTEALEDLYTEVLGRESDAGGLEYWESQMAEGMSLDRVKEFFLDSEEYKNNNESSEISVGDDPSVSGEDAVAEDVIVEDAAVDVSADGIITSVDADGNMETVSGPSIAGFYEEILGREPDEEGLAFWNEQLNSGEKTLDEIEAFFLNSDEALANLDAGNDGDIEGVEAATDQNVVGDVVGPEDADLVGSTGVAYKESNRPDTVEELYEAILGRDADEEGAAHWNEQIESGTMTLDDVADALFASPEYQEDVIDTSNFVTVNAAEGQSDIMVDEQIEINNALSLIPDDVMSTIIDFGVDVVITTDTGASEYWEAVHGNQYDLMAYYDINTQEVVVPSSYIGDEAPGSTLIHELGHAFDAAISDDYGQGWFHSENPEWQAIVDKHPEWTSNEDTGLHTHTPEGHLYYEAFARAFNDLLLKEALQTANPEHPDVPAEILAYLEQIIANVA